MPKTKTTKAQRTEFEAMGRAAHAAGVVRRPWADPALAARLPTGRPIGSQPELPELAGAWLRGWDAASLAAPLAE